MAQMCRAGSDHEPCVYRRGFLHQKIQAMSLSPTTLYSQGPRHWSLGLVFWCLSFHNRTQARQSGPPGFSEVLTQQGKHQTSSPPPNNVTGLRKPKLSKKIQRLFSCGGRTCSPRCCPACHGANLQGDGKSSHASGVVTRAVSLPAPFDFRTPVLAGHAGSGPGRWVRKGVLL